MKNINNGLKLLITIGGAITLILVMVAVYLYVDNNKNSSEFNDTEAGETLEAYYNAIRGDNSELEKLGIVTNVNGLIEEILLSNSTVDSTLYNQLSKYYDNFSIRIIEENEYVDEKDSKEKVDIIYEVDTYEYVDLFYSMIEDDNIDKYLTEEEIEIFKAGEKKYSEEKVQEVNDKLYDAHYKEMEKLEPTSKTYMLTLVRNDDGIYDFEYFSENNNKRPMLMNLLLAVIDKNSQPETELD